MREICWSHVIIYNISTIHDTVNCIYLNITRISHQISRRNSYMLNRKYQILLIYYVTNICRLIQICLFLPLPLFAIITCLVSLETVYIRICEYIMMFIYTYNLKFITHCISCTYVALNFKGKHQFSSVMIYTYSCKIFYFWISEYLIHLYLVNCT